MDYKRKRYDGPTNGHALIWNHFYATKKLKDFKSQIAILKIRFFSGPIKPLDLNSFMITFVVEKIISINLMARKVEVTRKQK